MTTYLVTGATGFLGGEQARRLLARLADAADSPGIEPTPAASALMRLIPGVHW